MTTPVVILGSTVLWPTQGDTNYSAATTKFVQLVQTALDPIAGLYGTVAGIATEGHLAINSSGELTLAIGTGSPVVVGGVQSFNTRTGDVTLTSLDVTDALGYIPGTGSVTSVTGANGVTVATGTTTPVIGLGDITPTGNITVAASKKIQGDFSNATVANRTVFQSSTTNGVTGISAIPNGTSQTAAFNAENSSTLGNNSLVNIQIGATEASINSSRRGTGTYLPLKVYTNGTVAATFDTTQNLTVVGTVTGSNLSGTNTGDQTLNSLLPSQTGNTGKFLTTDGTNTSWGSVTTTPSLSSISAAVANNTISNSTFAQQWEFTPNATEYYGLKLKDSTTGTGSGGALLWVQGSAVAGNYELLVTDSTGAEIVSTQNGNINLKAPTALSAGYASTGSLVNYLSATNAGISLIAGTYGLAIDSTTGAWTVGSGSGTTGQVLTVDAGGAPYWAASAGGGVTSVDTAGTVSGLTLTGGPITTSGTVTLGGNITSATAMTGAIATPTYIDFATGATVTPAVGRLTWDATDGTLQLGLVGGNVNLQIGQETNLYVSNRTGTNLLDSQVVRILGASGNRATIELAQADTYAHAKGTIGMLTENINDNQQGFVTTYGIVRDINTGGMADGDVLYLSATTAGGYTNVKPVAPNQIVILGYVIRAHATVGQILVNVVPAQSLSDLSDVQVTTPTTGQALIYNGGYWANAALSGSGTVTDVSVVTANGISGSVATSTTTPAITLSLGDITPNKVTIGQTAGSDGLVFTNGSLIRVPGSIKMQSDSSANNTVLRVIPYAATTTSSGIKVYDQTDTNNSGLIHIIQSTTNSGLYTSHNGTGTAQSLKLGANDITGITIDTSGNTTFSNTVNYGSYEVGYKIMPQNSQSADYTAVLDDSSKQIFHPSADTTARTFTIPANGSVAYPIGTTLSFINQNSAGVLTIAITTDTMRLAGAGTTGSRTLAANGIATAVKITSTEWIISGVGLT